MESLGRVFNQFWLWISQAAELLLNEKEVSFYINITKIAIVIIPITIIIVVATIIYAKKTEYKRK